jgi:hypothetical protein
VGVEAVNQSLRDRKCAAVGKLVRKHGHGLSLRGP